MNQFNMRFPIFCLLSMFVVVAGQAAEKIDYVQDVVPILRAHCVACHTVDEPEGGLVMESHSALMRGGVSGLAVTAGEANSSRMILRINGKAEPRMPPEGEEPLTETQIATLAKWVEQGASGPDGVVPVMFDLKVPSIKTKPEVSLPLSAVAVSLQGSETAVGRTGLVQIKDTNGKLLRDLTSRDDPTKQNAGIEKVNALQFSRNGDRLVVSSGVAGAYGRAVVFSTETGEVLHELGGHRDVLYAAKFSPDGKVIATAGYDREIKLWDSQSGELLRSMIGHNGAIYDLAFSPDGKVLISGCADETVKLWSVATGKRLNTLGQPEGEVLAVGVSGDGKFIMAGSSDNRLRVWTLNDSEQTQTNPIFVTRSVSDSPLLKLQAHADGKRLVGLTEKGDLVVVDTDSWNTILTLDRLSHRGTDFAITSDGKSVLVTLVNGELVKQSIEDVRRIDKDWSPAQKARYLDGIEPVEVNESELRKGDQQEQTLVLQVKGGAVIAGAIGERGEVDAYQWQAKQGEVWAIDADAGDGSQIDPFVSIIDADNHPVLRVRLQAVRDSYFTFRGKDSKQIGDFRLFNWQNMHLNDFLYAAGEVTRLWMYPRGPDSGYNVYPNEGDRWTYFGTSHTTHALGEPAYVVRPLASDGAHVANGLPVFEVHYENDDDPTRLAGKNSRLIFTVPEDGAYTVRVSDTRGDGGDGYGYQLTIRPAKPAFKASVEKPKADIRKGAGREVVVRVDRFDEFDGPVTFELQGLPQSLVSSFPVTIERGQRYAVGTIWAAEAAEAWDGDVAPKLVARADVLGKMTVQQVGDLGVLKLGGQPSVVPSIQPAEGEVGVSENWTLQVQRGQSVAARVVVRRREGFTGQVSFGKENAGRNATHGVYVDNIGLNGLLVRQGENERGFVLTADPIAELGKRSFFLRAEVDGNVTTYPITVEVLP
ncbi:MAG: WD40 repeat domain-containing protein [Rubripirellula sp.]